MGKGLKVVESVYNIHMLLILSWEMNIKAVAIAAKLMALHAENRSIAAVKKEEGGRINVAY